MSMHRREFIQAGTAAAFLAALKLPALAADAPTVGLIFPPANYPIPPDAGRLYPSGVRFIGNGLGFNGMTIESYNEAIPRARLAFGVDRHAHRPATDARSLHSDRRRA